MQDGKPRVVLVEHPVRVVCGLVRALLITGADRLIADDVIRGGEDADQLRNRAVNDLCHLSGDDLASTLYLVPVRVTKVILK